MPVSSPENTLSSNSLFPLDINQLIHLIDELAEGVYGIDIQGRCLFCNKHALQILQYQNAQQLIGRDMFNLAHHSNSDGSKKRREDFKLEQSITQGIKVYCPQEWLWCKDGSSVPVEIWSYPYFDNGNIVGAIVAFINISTRVHTQNRLETSLERYRMLIESTQVVPWEFDLVSMRFTFVSPQAVAMFGYPITDWYKKQFWEDHIHNDDRERTLQTCKTSLESNTSYELDYRMIKADGSIFYVKDYISVISTDGVVTGLRGIFADITLSKLQEEELRLAAATFDSASGIFITDKCGVILKVNRAFTEITGYAENDVVGKTPRLFHSGRHDTEFYEKMWKEIFEQGRWQGEIWNLRSSGEEYPEWLTITAIYNNIQEPTHYVAVFTDISEAKIAQEKIKFQSHYDSLTRLPNRTLLNIHLNQAISQARKLHHFGALLLMDLDEFKLINDSLGHESGDKLLKKIALDLLQLVSNGDVVARLGGDEFAVLIPDLGGDSVASVATADKLAKTICQSLFKTYEINKKPVHFGTSIGVSIFSGSRVSASDVLKQADTAMYNAKSTGKNRICHFIPEMQIQADKRLTIQGELKTALDRDQLELYFQPQFDNLGELSGVEALVRWNHPVKGLIPPNDFIPIAEQSGLIIPLGKWVLQTACDIFSSWIQCFNLDSLRISVNVSSHQFHQANFVTMVTECLVSANLDPARLDLEITEEVLIGDVDKIIDIIKRLQALNISFAIDDFGTGYSSLSYLKKLPIDMLKIDRSFIMNLPDDQDDAAIADTIIVIAKHMNLRVIAEGVETESQLAFLKEKGCDHYQGFYYSRPVPRGEFEHRFLKNAAIFRSR